VHMKETDRSGNILPGKCIKHIISVSHTECASLVKNVTSCFCVWWSPFCWWCLQEPSLTLIYAIRRSLTSTFVAMQGFR
jgi:hypothetical protein